MQNTSAAPINYSGINKASWLSLGNANGILPPNTSAKVTMTINHAADTLAPGTYSGTLTFTDLTNSSSRTRPVYLTIYSGDPQRDILYTPVTPCRIVDTRNTSAGIIGAFTQRDFHVYGSGGTISAQGGNPGGCSSSLGEPLAAHINMVAVNPTGKGNLMAFPVGAGTGAGLSVNYNTIDTNLASAGTVKTSPDITVASSYSSAH
jgi:hypothetical protein